MISSTPSIDGVIRRPRLQTPLPSALHINDIVARLSRALRTHANAVFLFGVVLLLIALVKAQSISDILTDPLLVIYTLVVTLFQLSRMLSAVLFTHTKEMTGLAGHQRNFEPTISFVIPAFNEADSIERSVVNSFAARYPKDKIEVIAIDDGSTDETLEVLYDLKRMYSERNFTIIPLVKNRGKRFAMAEGFRRAKGEIIIQLDSDSFIEPGSLRTFVQPFQHAHVGAVCAHAEPANAETNTVTKMQAAYYFMSFRILKAAESTFAAVLCCSGCSSAYRRCVIVPILGEWLAESFLGKPVTWGEDRSLTNWVIKQGYNTLYSDDANAYTIVPDTFKKFLKQQIRWKKGWFVNTVFASRFMPKRHPFVSTTYFFPLFLITIVTPFMAFKGLVYNPLTSGNMPYLYVAGILLVAVVITLYYRIVSSNRYWPYVFVWSGINMIFLSFILIYALATIQDRKWGTR
jgi:hyaluronan synthase